MNRGVSFEGSKRWAKTAQRQVTGITAKVTEG